MKSYQDLIDAEDELAEYIRMKAHTRLGGFIGDSILEAKPKEIVELEAKYAAMEAEYQANISALEEDAEQNVQPEEDNEPFDEEVGENIADGEEEGENGEQEDVDAAEATDNFEGSKAPTVAVKSISSVRYVRRKGPAIANVGFSRYSKMLKALQTGESSLSFTEARDRLNKSLRILPKHFSGKPVQMQEAPTLSESLVVRKHSQGMFIDRDREASVVTSTDEAKMKRFSGNDNSPSNIITNKPLYSKSEVYIVPRTRTADPNEALEKLYRPQSVGAQVLHTSRRDGGSAADSVHLTPLVLSCRLLQDNDPLPTAVTAPAVETPPRTLAPLVAASESAVSAPLTPPLVSSPPAQLVADTPRSRGFFVTMLNEEEAPYSAPQMRVTSPPRSSSPSTKKPQTCVSFKIPSNTGLSTPKTPLSRLSTGTGNRRSSKNLSASLPILPRERTPSSPGSPPRLHTGSRVL